MQDYFDKLEDQYANAAIDAFFKALKDSAEASAKIKELIEPYLPKK